MDVVYNYDTGHLVQVESNLKRTLGQYACHNAYIKVGITVDPEKRFKWHQKERASVGDYWERMVVIYGTSSWDVAKRAERRLIKYAHNAGYEAEVFNDAPGGEGRRPHEGQFCYVYVLLADPFASRAPEFLYSTGHLCDVEPELRRALGQYARQHGHLKVGITVDPVKRFRDHQMERAQQADSWSRMVVIYGTSSWDVARDAEARLVRYAKSAGYEAEVWNEAPGGEGRRPDPSKYCYVYVLLD